uniref:Uncharacterized protein n=1 Tax=Anguilla anguilla TaxID=7936 RepID=A0A0E9XAY1_ANGAN
MLNWSFPHCGWGHLDFHLSARNMNCLILPNSIASFD